MFIKRIFNKLIIKKNYRYANKISTLFNDKINFLDIGASGGLEPRWKKFEGQINTQLIEPDERSIKNFDTKDLDINLIWSEETDLDFYLTRKKECSSVFTPNENIINKYPNKERYEVIKKKKIFSNTIDNIFFNQNFDFIKIDTQGSELNILMGGRKKLQDVLGLEIEVEFSKVYNDQPLFEDVKDYVEKEGFVFIDFVTINRWGKDKIDGFGSMIHADALFLRDPDTMLDNKKNINSTVIEKYMQILFIYNRLDILKYLEKKIYNNTILVIKIKKLIKTLEKDFFYLKLINRIVYPIARILGVKENKIHWFV